MSMEAFAEKRKEKIGSRIETTIVDKGEDHIPVGSSMSRAVLTMLLEPPAKEAFDTSLNTEIIQRLASRGIVAEVYAARGDLGSGQEDSPDYVRVVFRNGEPGAPRIPLPPYQEYIVRASMDNTESR